MTTKPKQYCHFLFVILLILPLIASSQNDEEKLKQVDQFLAAKYTNQTPGCEVGIVKDGKLIYNKGFGMANLDYDISWDPESVINIMSISKQFTAACIALLVLDHKLSLQDDIRKYLPEFPDYGHTITIDHLIRHTSGISLNIKTKEGAL